MNDMEFSETVRTVLFHRRETREQVAPKVNLSVASLTQRINGRSRWTIQELMLLAAHWRVAPSDLLQGPGPALKAIDDASPIAAR